jgi:DNA-binding CsgD family transcriptional regulator
VSRVWPLRGRDRQRQRILEGLEADRVQLVVGDAGIGKTRLVSEVVAALDGSGVRTGRVAGAAAAVSLPFAPFLGFRSGNEAAPSVTSVVAALVGDASNRSGTVAPPVLQVDDVHLLDDGSSSLLCQLALDGRVRLALTVRAGESLPRAVASLARDVEIDRIVLEPLPVEVSIDLLQAALDGPVDGATARRLAVSAGGNPLVLRELTEGAIDAGILVQRIGLWRLERELVVDPALLDLVAARLAALDQRARDTLELLALAGPLGLAELVELDALAPVEDLERVGLVTVRGEAADLIVECAHPIHSEVLGSQMPRVARLRHSRRLAELVERGSDQRPETKTRATLWRFESGDDLSADRLLASADFLRTGGDLVRSAQLALASCARVVTPEAVLLASWSSTGSGDQATARAVLRRYAHVAASDRDVAALAHREAEQIWWADGGVDEARAVLSSTRDRLAGSPWADLMVAQRGVFDYLAGEVAGVEAAVAPLLDHEEPAVRTTAALAVEMARCETGRPSSGAELAEAALLDALESPVRFIGDAGIHLVAHTACRIAAGQLASADELAELLYQLALGAPAPQPRGWASLIRGQVRVEQGRFDDAMADLTEAELIWSDLDLPGMARRAGARVVLAAAFRGDAFSTIAAIDRLADYRADGFEGQNIIVARALAWAESLVGASGIGDRLADHACLPDALVRAATDHRWCEVSAGAVDLVRLGSSAEAEAAMAGVPRGLDPVVERRRRLIEVAVAGDGEAIEAAAGEASAEGWAPIAADWFALAWSAREGAGAGDAAQRSLTALRAELRRCQGLVTPLVRPVLERSALTSREREIAELAGQGWSNRKISTHLVLSERTVENHLYRAFSKLAISSRDQLDGAL